MGEQIFIGVAWPYANGPIHLGHAAGAYTRRTSSPAITVLKAMRS